MTRLISLITAVSVCSLFVISCGLSSGDSGHGNAVGYSETGKILADFPTVGQRKADIASEQKGSHYIGRRYFVNKTTFWGYLRKPGTPWSEAKLTTMNEWSRYTPDRLHQDGPSGARNGFDQNYEYKIWGYYTGEKVYEPNSNQFVEEFKLTNYELISKEPGWLFTPSDLYNPDYITLKQR